MAIHIEREFVEVHVQRELVEFYLEVLAEELVLLVFVGLVELELAQLDRAVAVGRRARLARRQILAVTVCAAELAMVTNTRCDGAAAAARCRAQLSARGARSSADDVIATAAVAAVMRRQGRRRGMLMRRVVGVIVRRRH